MQQMRQVGADHAESRRQVDAVHAVHAGLEGGEAADRHLPRVAPAGRGVDEADDVHQGEERDVAAVGARRQLLRLPLEPRSAGERRVAQSALHDASRRRRGPPGLGCERGRVGLRVQRRRTLARVPLGQERRRTALLAAGEPSRHRGRGADHQAPDRRALVAVGARRQADLFRDAGHDRRGREGPARQEVHRQHPQPRDTGLEPVGARRRRARARSASPRAAPTPRTTSRFRRTASGSASADCRRTATSAASRRRTSTPICICSKPPPVRSSA